MEKRVGQEGSDTAGDNRDPKTVCEVETQWLKIRLVTLDCSDNDIGHFRIVTPVRLLLMMVSLSLYSEVVLGRGWVGLKEVS